MARTWLRIQVDLLGGPGIDCDPTPGRVFIVGPAHTFEQFAHAINVAFARWDLSHIHQFELTDGRLIGYPDDTHAPDLVWLDHAKLKVAREVKPEDEFEFVFDLGDNWQHRCTVPEPRSTRSRNTELFRPARSRSSDGDGSPTNTAAIQNTATQTPTERRARRHFAPLAYGSLRENPPAIRPSSGLLFDRP